MNEIRYNGLTFDQLYKLLSTTEIPHLTEEQLALVTRTAEAFGDAGVGLLHVFSVTAEKARRGLSLYTDGPLYHSARRLLDVGLFEQGGSTWGGEIGRSTQTFRLSALGNLFLLRLRVERNAVEARKNEML